MSPAHCEALAFARSAIMLSTLAWTRSRAFLFAVSSFAKSSSRSVGAYACGAAIRDLLAHAVNINSAASVAHLSRVQSMMELNIPARLAQRDVPQGRFSGGHAYARASQFARPSGPLRGSTPLNVSRLRPSHICDRLTSSSSRRSLLKKTLRCSGIQWGFSALRGEAPGGSGAMEEGAGSFVIV